VQIVRIKMRRFTGLLQNKPYLFGNITCVNFYFNVIVEESIYALENWFGFANIRDSYNYLFHPASA
jgi:hypothetical protein